ncbi:hypothetical protein HO133_008043 [Letharia lupina]|uniref:Nab2-like CCCH zinc finger domain-containing protein n=1 Tax=Letharia lupina TaxID=560253 RepID=A0A8H6CRP7_9LECA|nr:uncharacterized protein HO133_008043 [Letharia lupina]KAF6228313.1 hypothetical protein HO133_008043 [Letharia lupina]
MAVEVVLNTPLADALSNVVQPKLSEVGWSTGGLDDSALGEYIILMLVNGKTQEQIAAELSNDLLNLGPDDTGATDFAKWLFEQVDILNGQLNGPPAFQISQAQQGQAIPSYVDEGSSFSGGNRHPNDGGGTDADMGEAMDGVHNGAMYASVIRDLVIHNPLTDVNRPTGPKSMRNPSRNGNKRIIGQISKAMDRSGDVALHRVRPQQGTERINTHSRPPPKGPRTDQNRIPRTQPNGRRMGMPNTGAAGPLMQLTPQEQMLLMSMYEDQARMMQQIFSPQQQQMFMPSINPAFQNGAAPSRQQPGRSLFERVEGNPQRQNGHFNKGSQLNGARFQSQEPSTDTDIPSSYTNGDISSSMEVESSQNNPPESASETICRFNLTCTKTDCPYAHQSPEAPPGTTIDVNDECPFGAACKSRKCVGRHPSPAQRVSHQSEQDCRFFPHCANPSCPFRHPTAMPPCRFGADCKKEECKFMHVKTMCRFNPCLNPQCPFKHAEGQKRGVFGDKVWRVADDSEDKGHVSERKFVDEMGEEELVVPDVKLEDIKAEDQTHGSQSSSLGADVVT